MPKLTRQEHVALKAVAKGEADEGQQTLAISALIKKICVTHDQAYIPGDDRATAFVCGRQFCGYKLLKFINTPVENNNEIQIDG